MESWFPRFAGATAEIVGGSRSFIAAVAIAPPRALQHEFEALRDRVAEARKSTTPRDAT